MIQDIVEAADLNLITHFTWAQERTEGMFVQKDGELCLSDSGLATDTFNTVSRARLVDAGSRVAAAVDYFRSRARPFAWWLGPNDTPADLPALLVEAGLEFAESETGMFMDLADLASRQTLPEGFEIRRVSTPAALMDFARVNACNWDPPDELVPEFYRRVAGSVLSKASPLRFYVGYAEGEAVATAEGTLAAGVVGLYNISTLETHRGRGYGSAMTARPLLDAREEGYQVAILQASSQGLNIYRRIGFKAYGTIREYKPVQRH